jgi:hypothetical protein
VDDDVADHGQILRCSEVAVCGPMVPVAAERPDLATFDTRS